MTMFRYVAFLRAINVGGHTVKMETLCQLFESFGFSAVETFIASGNLIFESTDSDAALLEARIAGGLQNALGYAVAAFIRTPAELAQVVAYPAFPQPDVDSAAAYNVAFLSVPLDEAQTALLAALTTSIDRFAAHGRAVYWLCQTIQSQSTFSNAVLEKKLGLRSTLRGMHTLKKLVEKVSSRPPGL
jgi:uncharacterized protein (DUF1697 family)